jgi:hypothetical protein
LFGHYLPFWCGPALDRENSGWMGWLANDLSPIARSPRADREQPDFVGLLGRHRVRPEPVYRRNGQTGL